MTLKQSTKSNFFKLLLLEPKLLFFGLISLALGSAINLLIPELVRRYLNNNFLNTLTSNYYNVALLLIFIFALQGLCFYFRSYSFNLLGHKIAYRLRSESFKNLLTKTISFFDNTNSAGISSRIINDTQVIQDIFSLRISVLIRYGFQVIAGAILMFVISPRLAFLILLVIPILVVFGYILGKKLKHCSKILQEELGNSTNLLNEIYASIKIIFSFGNRKIEIARFNSANENTLKAGINRSKVSSFFSSFISFLMNVAIVVFFFYGLSLVKSNDLSYGDLTAFLLYGAIVAVSFSFAISSYSDVLQGIGALNRINELNTSEIDFSAEKNITPQGAFNNIKFNQVTFSYDSREKQSALKNINLEINANSFVALVGSSGSGKSTLANLLLGFYKPTFGEILFDNINFNHINKEWLYKITAYVPQDPVLFNLTIRENILYGNLKATDSEILEVCKQLNLMGLIETLPQGINTLCGERGLQLSGGERQRIALARAIIRKPKLLVLDEATSALDAESEEYVKRILYDMKARTTIIMIAHRLSSIREADCIYVFKDGQIIQSGKHQDIASFEGLYKNMIELLEL